MKVHSVHVASVAYIDIAKYGLEYVREKPPYITRIGLVCLHVMPAADICHVNLASDHGSV
jgi:predicted aconitase